MKRTALALALLCGVGAVLAFRPSPDTGPPADRPLAPFAVPPDPFRIAVLGTSLTARYDWPTRAGARLVACIGRPAEVTTVALEGANSDWGLGQIDRVAALSPDVVLVEFAINDADLRDGLSPLASTAAHAAIVTGLRDRLPRLRIGLMTMSPAQGPRGWLRPGLATRYATYRGLAAELDTGLLDLYPRWQALPPEARGLAADGLHPDPDVAAGLILPALLPWLAAAVGKECPS